MEDAGVDLEVVIPIIITGSVAIEDGVQTSSVVVQKESAIEEVLAAILHDVVLMCQACDVGGRS